ncbi:hypothetical protein [uncultured Roseibium sp.]|uniref:hypothetical protein n=1 Tax=uncultured Roseibium sp. TaxID=1936171 RepID=UPI00260533C8|nr:hypothetical protein [uncultured Roseibium sp.]
MKKPKRLQIITYVSPELHERITCHAKRTNLSVSRVAERVLESGKYPDVSNAQAIQDLLAVNADQARLGNLLLKAINETADGHLVRQMQSILKDVRKTQTEIKARVARIRP